jgi:hypothetical protein
MTAMAAMRAPAGRGSPEPPLRISLRTDADDFVVSAEALWIGEDIVVCLWGGERPHVGAVAAAQPRPSLRDPETRSATASILTYLGHKEDVVVKAVSESLAAALDTNVVVTAGIHWDDLDQKGIDTVLARAREIVAKLEARLKETKGRIHD